MCLKFETSRYFSSLRLPSDLAPHNLVHKALKLASRLSAALLGVSLDLNMIQKEKSLQPRHGIPALPCQGWASNCAFLSDI